MLTIYIQLVISPIVQVSNLLYRGIFMLYNYLSSSQAQLWNIEANTHRAGSSFSGLPSPLHPAAVVVPLFNRRTGVSQGFQHNQGPDPLQSPHAQKKFLPGLCLILFFLLCFLQVLNREANLSCWVTTENILIQKPLWLIEPFILPRNI